MDCGPSCLAMISQYYGKKHSLSFIRDKCFINKNGVNLLGIAQAAEDLGFETLSVKLSLEKLYEDNDNFPCIIHWNQNHFVILNKIIKSKISKKYKFHIIDPAYGSIVQSEENFKNGWMSSPDRGIALFLKPIQEFYKKKEVLEKTNFFYILKYIKPFRWKLLKVLLVLTFGSLLTLIFPFLTEKLVDNGIKNKNLNFITLILLSQLLILFGNTFFDIIRNRIILFIGSRINIEIISDFFGKLMMMPLRFFDSKRTGDLIQRIQDHRYIENFLTSQSVLTLFAIINFFIFFSVLAYYSWFVVTTYFVLTLISIFWVLFFQNKRRILDYNRFELLADNQNTTYELITGMQEIKLNSFENFKKSEWKDIQEKLFKVNIKVLNVDQYQLSGYAFLNNIKNIVVTFFVAQSVIKGHLTLGAMMSTSYIIGELNSPISQLISFFRSIQDAKISFSRLNEIHNQTEESVDEKLLFTNKKKETPLDIHIENLNFQYEGPKSPYILKNINLKIFENKVTAIVGESGSGKTSLMKILLKYYQPVQGNIYVGNENLSNISFNDWRNNFGVVMQDGFIFSDTIQRNIATNEEKINIDTLNKAVEIANINDFIKSLPLGYKTKIGLSGKGISGGQKQRLLIARAVYRNPQFVFLDEATSALDSENEKIIHDNLQKFFKGKTVVIIAHRLSTVKNADNIVVLKKGEVVEEGKHHELVIKKGEYYNLIKNQLELGA